MASKLTLHQGHDLPDDVIDVERDLLNVSLFRERPDAPDYLIRPIAVVYYPFDRAARCVQVRSLAIEPAQSSLCVGFDRGERLIQFVGDRGRQLAHRRDAVGVGEFQLRLTVSMLVFASFCLNPLALSQIKYVGDTLVPTLFKCCPTNQYGHTATVFSGVFLFERLEPAATFLLFDPC